MREIIWSSTAFYREACRRAAGRRRNPPALPMRELERRGIVKKTGRGRWRLARHRGRAWSK